MVDKMKKNTNEILQDHQKLIDGIIKIQAVQQEVIDILLKNITEMQKYILNNGNNNRN